MDSKIPRAVHLNKENNESAPVAANAAVAAAAAAAALRRKSKRFLSSVSTGSSHVAIKSRLNRKPLQNVAENAKPKSVADGFVQKRTTTVTARPNTATTTGALTTNNQAKSNVGVAPSKAALKKPAPYDYKARYALEKEKHDDLLKKYRELKEISSDAETLRAANVDLLAKAERTHKELAELRKQCLNYRDLQQSYDDILTLYNQKDSQLKSTQVELNLARQSLKSLQHDNEQLRLSNERYEREHGEYRDLLDAAETQRRQLHNEVLDLKGSIRVFCRVRPPLESEQSRAIAQIVYSNDCTKIEIQACGGGGGSGANSSDHDSVTQTPKFRFNKQSFTFDKVFDANSSQADVFVELSYLVQSVLDGYNVCVFAYGQTGSGKTYTMEGDINHSQRQGMIPRSIALIFEKIQQGKLLGFEYKIEVSILEIYNEHIFDLLSPTKNQRDHEIRNNGNDIFVTNLETIEIENREQLLGLIKTAQRNRAVAATENNERSSRSHSVAKIRVTSVNKQTQTTFVGSLNLVDLAGSEKVAAVIQNERLAETKNINKSLSCLSTVILSLLQKNEHIPYRNSKLTYYLKPCLGGNSKTLMMVNVSPFDDCYNESINALRFAASVNQCKLGTVKQNRLHH